MLRSSRLQVSSRFLDATLLTSSSIFKTLLMLRWKRSSSNFSDALDATLFTSSSIFKTLLMLRWKRSSSNFSDALDATLLTSSSNFSDALDATRWTSSSIFKTLLMLRSSCLQVSSRRLWSNGCTECGLSLLLPKMCIRSWLKSWNEKKTSTWKCETSTEKSK